jgi:hypothetical protein
MAISKDPAFGKCVILDQDAFDPDAVFLDDIVNDDVLPKLSLAVDGLTAPVDGAGGDLEMLSEDTAANRVIRPSATLPATTLDPEQLEVYGWESSIWRKIRGYLGF